MPTFSRKTYQYADRVADRLSGLELELVDYDEFFKKLTLHDVTIATVTAHPTRPGQRLLEGPLGAMVCAPKDLSRFRPERRLGLLQQYVAYAVARLRSPYIDDPDDVTRIDQLLDQLTYARILNRRKRPDGRRERFDAFMEKWRYDSLGLTTYHHTDKTLRDIIDTFRSEERTYHTDSDVFLFGNLPLGYIQDNVLYTVIGQTPVTTNAYNAWMTCLLRLRNERDALRERYTTSNDMLTRRDAKRFVILRNIATYYESNLSTCGNDPQIAGHVRSRHAVRQFITHARRMTVHEVTYALYGAGRPHHEDAAFEETLRDHTALRKLIRDPRSALTHLDTLSFSEHIEIKDGNVYFNWHDTLRHVGYWFGGPNGFREFGYEFERRFYGSGYAYATPSYAQHIKTTFEDRIAELLTKAWRRLVEDIENAAAAYEADPSDYWTRDALYEQVKWTDVIRHHTC